MLKIQTDTCIEHLNKAIRQREYGRVHMIHQGEEGIKALHDPREAEVLNLIDCAKRIGREKVATQPCKMATMVIHV